MASIRTSLRSLITKSHILRLSSINSPQIRNSGYQSSPFLVDVEVPTKYEVTKNPDEWKHVERVLPPVLVPEPKKLAEYRSGWKPPGDVEELQNKPYFVGRTKNHMMPVYLIVKQRGQKKHTVIRKIKGDIWQLERDLRPYLEDIIKPKNLLLQVNEFASKIVIHGDHVNAVKYWLGERNF